MGHLSSKKQILCNVHKCSHRVWKGYNYYICPETSTTEKFRLFHFVTNAHGKFWNFYITINLKINISEINRPIKLEFCMFSIFKI